MKSFGAIVARYPFLQISKRGRIGRTEDTPFTLSPTFLNRIEFWRTSGKENWDDELPVLFEELFYLLFFMPWGTIVEEDELSILLLQALQILEECFGVHLIILAKQLSSI